MQKKTTAITRGAPSTAARVLPSSIGIVSRDYIQKVFSGAGRLLSAGQLAGKDAMLAPVIASGKERSDKCDGVWHDLVTTVTKTLSNFYDAALF
jgi:hypothetical protein